jgi:hypothetical protein
MSTRSTVKFYNKNKCILSVYQQFDGYVEGVGHSLANWLYKKTIIDGINDQKLKDGFANGMGCLAAQYVAENKLSIGKFYLTTSNDIQEYNYKVRFINNQFIIEINDFFKGTPKELLNFKEY